MNQQTRVKEVFLAAAGIESVAERDAYLKDACGDDVELLDRVVELLRADDDPESYLEIPAVEVPDSEDARQDTIALNTPSVPDVTGSRIGSYKLLQEIGHGGFGVVYMAEQERPVRRTVALKIIKPGMDSKEVIARFEAERQALALMDHPNIAKVLDAGATSEERPYFVMELVKGVPITEFCDRNALSTCERLELFVVVCQAVQHAHQKGVIHRDLKPSNVMVTLHDGKPVPKVIDFGISKAISQRLTEKTLFTRYGQMIGTPQYMSPEQAEMSGLDVDTRSDVYSLGVLLYELLTGTTPLQSDQLRTAGYAELLRMIQEEEAPRPSSRLSTHGDRLTVICKQRSTSERLLHQAIEGDLDWIVMKSLDKDRNRRYETANGLANDVLRHLRDEPVLAVAPSRTYLISRWVRRNRGWVTGAGLIAASLLIGLGAASWGWVRATQERGAAIRSARTAFQAQAAAEKQRDIAQHNQEVAEQASQRSKATLGLLTEMLATARPGSTRGTEYTVRELLDEVAAKIDSRLDGDLSAQAELHAVIGKTYEQLNLIDRGIQHLGAAVELSTRVNGREDLVTLQHQIDLNWARLSKASDLGGMESDMKRIISALAQIDPPPTALMNARVLLAHFYERTDRAEQSAAECRRALDETRGEAGDDRQRQVIGQLHYLLAMLVSQRMVDEPTKLALEHAEAAIQLFDQIPDQSTSRLLANKVGSHLMAGIALADTGDYDAADPHLHFAAENSVRAGTESFAFWIAQACYVCNLIDQGRVDQANSYIQQFGEVHENGTYSVQSIARDLQALIAEYVGDFEAAEKLRKFEMTESLSSAELMRGLEATANYARCFDLQNKTTQADGIYAMLLPMGKQHVGDMIRKSNRAAAYLAAPYSSCLAYYSGSTKDDLSDAARISKAASHRWRGNGREAYALLANGVANIRLGHTEVAERALRKCLSITRPHLRPIRREAERVLVNLLVEHRSADASAEFFDSHLNHCRATLGETHPETLGVQVRYSDRLIQLGNHDLAESLLLIAAKQVDTNSTLARRVRGHAARCLVQLYTEMNRQDLASQWQVMVEASDE